MCPKYSTISLTLPEYTGSKELMSEEFDDVLTQAMMTNRVASLEFLYGPIRATDLIDAMVEAKEAKEMERGYCLVDLG